MRLRDLSVISGRLPVGALNAITDVPGVKVGHVTLIEGEGALVEGQGPVRTGVTVILPHVGNIFRDKVAAGVATFNGFGKATGFEQIRELGTIETPVALTNTLNVPRVADALMSYMMTQNPEIGRRSGGTVNPVVGECNDGFLNDIRGRHVQETHVLQALATATDGPVPEGNVGAGVGTACCGFKAGIGTASRIVADGRFTLGALVQTNFGRRKDLLVLGVPVGMEMAEEHLPVLPPGSIMMVLATDAPLSSRQLNQVAMRACYGLGRLGAYGHWGSGDFAIAFSTTNRFPHGGDGDELQSVPRLHDSNLMDQLYLAAVEAIEEAVLNSLVAAEAMVGRDGHTLFALPHDRLIELLEQYGRRRHQPPTT